MNKGNLTKTTINRGQSLYDLFIKKNYKANIRTRLEIVKENALKKWKDRNSQRNSTENMSKKSLWNFSIKSTILEKKY